MKRSNDVFRFGERIELNACIGENKGRSDFEQYASGYLQAAIRLVESLEENSSQVDVIIYPLVNTFRHGIEIYIKHFAKVLPVYIEEESKLLTTHNLSDNWNTVKQLLRKAYNNNEEYLAQELEFDKVLTCILEIDPNGSRFRYPESLPDKKTKKIEHHLLDWSLINVSVLGEYIRNTYNVLEAWSCCVSWHGENYENKMSEMSNHR